MEADKTPFIYDYPDQIESIFEERKRLKSPLKWVFERLNKRGAGSNTFLKIGVVVLLIFIALCIFFIYLIWKW